MGGESALPRHENFGDVLAVVAPVIEKYVAEARTHHSGYDHGREECVQNAEVDAFFEEDFFHPSVPEEESEKEKNLVVPNEERSEFNAAVGDPGNRG